MASLLHQIVCGLEYLHGLGIIHGGAMAAKRSPDDAANRQRSQQRSLSLASAAADLTPSNVLLKLDSKERHKIVAKLAVSAVRRESDSRSKTQSCTITCPSGGLWFVLLARVL